jgi:XTP/dITP diphosphohydrolase
VHRQLTGSVVIATHNPGKLAEMRELLSPHGVAAQSAAELNLAEPDETGTTFADDSGLVVEALGGEPGIHSARWAGPDKDFRFAMNRIQTLLIERGARAPEQRRAHFIAALCLAWPDGHTEEFEGRVDGVIVWPPKGEAGFGYDPLFLPDGHNRTFGEMTALEKHGLPPLGLGLSHRARAFVMLAAACLRP